MLREPKISVIPRTRPNARIANAGLINILCWNFSLLYITFPRLIGDTDNSQALGIGAGRDIRNAIGVGADEIERRSLVLFRRGNFAAGKNLLLPVGFHR